MTMAEAYGVMSGLLESTRAPESAMLGPTDTARFVMAGNATFTLVSKKTGARFTYRVREAKEDDDSRMFVSVLTGSNNEGDYEYLGTIFEKKRFCHGRKSRVGGESPSAKAFAWFFERLVRGGDLSECEVWHSGRCGRCGRKLTVPESVASGLGPECGSKMS